MPNIRIDLDTPVLNGQALTFKAPADCSQITGLIIYYPEGSAVVSKDFKFVDAHGVDVGSGTISLFAANALVKVVLDTDQGKAYVQNADTNAYLEGKLAEKYSPENKPSKEDVGLGNVPNTATNDQTPTYTAASTLAALVSGEKLSVAFGKIAKAISDLISHLQNKSNPHGVTKEQVGLGSVDNTADSAKPVSTAQAAAIADAKKAGTDAQTNLNSHTNNKNNPHGVTAAQVGASPTGHKHTKSEITDFPSSLPASDVYSWAKAQNKPTYTASEVGARPNTWTPSPSDIGLKTEALTYHYEDGSTRTVEVYVK